MAENTFNSSLQQLLSGLDSFLSTKSVIGAPISINDTTILPLIDVSMGVGAGAFSGNRSDGGTGGGLGAKMSASGVLIIRNDGTVRIVNANNTDTLTKVVEMVPDVIDKIRSRKNKDPEVERAAEEAAKAEERVVIDEKPAENV